MAADTFVNQVQRVGTDTAGLAPGQAALVLDAAFFTVTDDPDAIVTGSDGATVTGVTRVTGKGVGGYIKGTLGAGAFDSVVVFYNDTNASIALSSLYLVPGADVATDGTNHVTVKLSNDGTPIATIDTNATALVQGTGIAWGVTPTVAAGKSLAMNATGHGTPPSVSLCTQGRLP